MQKEKTTLRKFITQHAENLSNNGDTGLWSLDMITVHYTSLFESALVRYNIAQNYGWVTLVINTKNLNHK